jgi:hypothetical protein
MAKTGRPRNGLPYVPTIAVGGVAVGSHMLTKQAERLVSLGNRLLRRLDRAERAAPDGPPDPAWIESYRYLAPTVLALLREQRERAVAGGAWPAPGPHRR